MKVDPLLKFALNYFDHSSNHKDLLIHQTFISRLKDYQTRKSTVKFSELFTGFDSDMEFELPTLAPKLTPLQTVKRIGRSLKKVTFKDRCREFTQGASDLFTFNKFNMCWLTHCNGRKTMILFKSMWDDGEYSKEELKAIELEFPEFDVIWMIISPCAECVDNNEDEDTDGCENVFVMNGRLILENTCPNLWAYFDPDGSGI